MTVDGPAVARRILSTLATIEYIGSPPELCVNLLSKVKDANSSIDDIAELVLCNPSISASLLKLCNSAFYNRGVVIDSVSRAIIHLGLETVVRFVYAMEMIGMFHGGKPVCGFDESVFWKSNLAGALLSQEIADLQKIENTESVFLAGLLRDMGVLLLRQYFPDLFADAWSTASAARCNFNDACSKICGLDHQSMAFLIAMRWKLPPMIMSIFQPPLAESEHFEKISLARNVVLFSDYILKINKIYTWDQNCLPDSKAGALWYMDSGIIDRLLTKIVSEVNEFFRVI
jgi:HD-like signal output (HDOD) protein